MLIELENELRRIAGQLSDLKNRLPSLLQYNEVDVDVKDLQKAFESLIAFHQALINSEAFKKETSERYV